MNSESAAGWHGKLPSVSDFASRRMDARLVDTWDDWISAGLAKMRSDDQERWVDAYLASPTWRFLSGPGFFPVPFDASAWAGVLMPSVDRVGRYYPLALTAPLHEIPRSTESRAGLWWWLQRLEDTAIHALEGDWSIEGLEIELFQLGLPLPRYSDSFAAQAPGQGVRGAGVDGFFDLAAAGSCAWYSDANDVPQVLHSRSRDEKICRLWERHALQR